MHPVLYAAIVPHSPWLVPEVGRGQERGAMRTVAALRRIGRDLAALRFDTLAIVTPHGAEGERPGVYTAPELRAGFAAYGDDTVAIARRSDVELAALLARSGVFSPLAAEELDHGAAVPLYFAARGLGEASLLAIAVPPRLAGDAAALIEAGRTLGALARGLNRRLAVLISAALARHRAGSGTAAEAETFDLRVQDAIAEGTLAPLFEIPRALAESVAEHALAPLALAAGLLDGLPLRRHVANSGGAYETPFNTGYLTATLYPPQI